jgi:hypothetical protein
LRVLHCREWDERCPFGKVSSYVLRGLDRKSRLSDTAKPCQGDKSYAVAPQHRREEFNILLAADQGSDCGGQLGTVNRRS